MEKARVIVTIKRQKPWNLFKALFKALFKKQVPECRVEAVHSNLDRSRIKVHVMEEGKQYTTLNQDEKRMYLELEEEKRKLNSVY